MKKLSKKELREQYIKKSNELNEFIELYSTTISGWDDDMVINDANKEEYEKLQNEVSELAELYKTAK